MAGFSDYNVAKFNQEINCFFAFFPQVQVKKQHQVSKLYSITLLID